MRNAGWAVAVALAMVTTGCGVLPGAAGQDASQPSTRTRTSPPQTLSKDAYYKQQLRWRACRDGFECAKLLVPLDYGDPKRGQLQLAVIRLPAGDPSRRIGSLVVNPGGPGGSGVDYARAARQQITAQVRQRFDVVGFDPRGVAASRPAVRCVPADTLDEYIAADASPDDRAEVRDLVDMSQEFVDGCEKQSAKLLPYVGTIDAARDMDVLRAALGDDGLTYLGKSYGTYLGAYYAELFPRRVRALVLDGAVDPDLSGEDTNRAQAKGFEVALRAFVQDCVRRKDCPLGSGGVDAAMGRLGDLLARTDRQPLGNQLNDGRQVTQSLAVLGIAAALYDKRAWQYLRLGLDSAFKGDGTVLLQLGDQLIGRRQDGTYTNQTESNLAINCVDRPMPSSVSRYEQDANEADKVAPHFGKFVTWGTLPCAYWPIDAKQRDIDAGGADPILVVGTTRDPATPYEWAEALADQLDSGVLLTLDGDGHTAYGTGNACIDRAVDAYLLEGTAPERGTTCR